MESIQGQFSRSKQPAISNSCIISAHDLQLRSQELLSYALSNNTCKLYDTAVNAFHLFCRVYQSLPVWPPSQSDLVNFVSYLSLQKFSANTIKTYVAGISYHCKLHGFPDRTQDFLLKKVLLGLSRSNPHHDTRKPITLQILTTIVQTLPSICHSYYESTLFTTIFVTAFFGFFRMGELVQNTKQDVGHAIQVQNVSYSPLDNTIKIVLHHSKTDQAGRGAAIQLKSTHKIVCPVSCIRLYLQLRPKCRGSLFCHISGSPVTRYQVVSVFNMLLEKLGLDTKLYKTHSFRIGAASNAWASGASQQSIAIEGRWKSSCLLNYIRQ